MTPHEQYGDTLELLYVEVRGYLRRILLVHETLKSENAAGA